MASPVRKNLLILGCGYVGSAVAAAVMLFAREPKP